jgi:inhibitor of KinA
MNVRFFPAGDAALVVEFGDRIERELSERLLHLNALVRESKIPGVVETVPTYRSLLVLYDPAIIDNARLVSAIEQLLGFGGRELKPSKLWRIPACYEIEHALDLAEVARRTGHSVEEIVQLHASTLFHVYMIGFVPGHPYMGDLPDWIALPRRTDPRVKVAAGSIAISGNISVIYPVESPGGWHLIGSTPIRLFDVRIDPPSLLSPGDKVRFHPITGSDFNEIRAAVQADAYRVAWEPVPL